MEVSYSINKIYYCWLEVDGVNQITRFGLILQYVDFLLWFCPIAELLTIIWVLFYWLYQLEFLNPFFDFNFLKLVREWTSTNMSVGAIQKNLGIGMYGTSPSDSFLDKIFNPLFR